MSGFDGPVMTSFDLAPSPWAGARQRPIAFRIEEIILAIPIASDRLQPCGLLSFDDRAYVGVCWWWSSVVADGNWKKARQEKTNYELEGQSCLVTTITVDLFDKSDEETTTEE